MNMNKILAAGLVAAVAITAAPEASADVCGNGGFYIGVNAGVSISRTKTKASAQSYKEDDYYHGGKLTDVAAKNITEESKVVAKAHNNVKKTKTRFLAELVLGYDWRINDVMMGVDLTFGSTFGKVGLKSKTEKDIEAAGDIIERKGEDKNDRRTFAKLKTQWHIALMPRVGYLFTPQLEGYLTAGVKMTRYKLETYKAADQQTDTKENAEAKFGTDADGGQYYSKLKKSKCRFVPIVGAGVRYEFTPELFAKLEYNYEFRTNVKVPKKALHDNISKLKVRTQAHVVKLGLGYRF